MQSKSEAQAYAQSNGFRFFKRRAGVDYYANARRDSLEIADTWAAEYRASGQRSARKVHRLRHLWEFARQAADGNAKGGNGGGDSRTPPGLAGRQGDGR